MAAVPKEGSLVVPIWAASPRTGLDRGVSNHNTEGDRLKQELIKYNAMAQHTGTWLRGYHWNIVGCGTYREPVSEVGAQALMKRFMERLARKLRTPVPYFAALERRYSGCGHSPIPAHWHFLAASSQPAGMKGLAQDLWRELFGDAKIDYYDSSKPGTYYVCKLAANPNCTILAGGIEKLVYRGPADLIAAAQCDPYVPDHLKNKVFGEFLRIRPGENLALQPFAQTLEAL